MVVVGHLKVGIFRERTSYVVQANLHLAVEQHSQLGFVESQLLYLWTLRNSENLS